MGSSTGLPSPLPDLLRPLPADAALRGHAMVPATVATVSRGTKRLSNCTAILPVGYVRGTVRVSAGQKAADFNIRPMHDPPVTQPVLRYDPDSGEFLHGPLLPGNVNYSLERADEGFDGPGAEFQRVDVFGGDVVQLDFRAETAAGCGCGSEGGKGRRRARRTRARSGVGRDECGARRWPNSRLRRASVSVRPLAGRGGERGLQRRGRWAHLARAMAWLLVWNRAR